ncbi:F-box protein [Endozoicomonas sp. SCSIO W0465]|uniref:F-box/WD repeat-containing protein n=1 Tax=Endozoicomonas sp. SCSIO W0465 TaxID=2918516 RepID=UPI002074E5FB|nr:F-box protein [Endozoicomonas sp. SCSIO W0465]USE37743.1 F-box protein [Endozoicomonas sp. SCSIO W0465]
MLIPTTQKKPCLSVLSTANPAIPEQAAQFHHRGIAQLPTELLLHITRHLSLKDACNLALTSRRMHAVLDEYGLFEVVRPYGSLSKNERLFYRDLSITNPQLIDHLRKSKIKLIARRADCTESLPAICAHHAYHLRHQITNTESINFVLKKSFGREENISDYYLNDNHSRLIIKDDRNSQLSIWTTENKGSWSREFIIESHRFFKCFHSIDRYHGNTVFIPADPPSGPWNYFSRYGANDTFLWFIQRNESGNWAIRQKMTVTDLFPSVADACGEQDTNYNFFVRQLSPDGKSLLYSKATGNCLILGQELDGKWAIKGCCPWSSENIFSPDSNHIAIGDECIKFFGKQTDGSWLATGILDFTFYATALIEGKIDEDIVGFETTAFSPDSQHFVASFSDAGKNCCNLPIYVKGFFIIVFSLGNNGQWSEVIKITKHQQRPANRTSLKATFSPDSKYLVVHADSSLDIWHLTDDNNWVAEIKDHEYFQQTKRYLPDSTVTFNANSSVFVLFREGDAMVWQLNSSAVWECQHQFTYLYNKRNYRFYGNFTVTSIHKVSPDGNTIVCTDDRGRLNIQVQKQYGEWTWQTPDGDLRIGKLVFNQEGYLFAGLTVDDRSCLVVLGITPNGIWQEKGRLHAEGNIKDFNFSPCGHSIMVESLDGYQEILSFWQIEQESAGNIQ